jgi:addiction module HigA family antidote
MMPMKNPPHPGGFVLRECIEPLGLSITDAAAALGVTRTTLSKLVNGKRGISPEMAVRLSKYSAEAPRLGSRSNPTTISRKCESSHQTQGLQLVSALSAPAGEALIESDEI